MSQFQWFATIITIFVIYFLPTMFGGNKKYFAGILIVNTFLGWTLLGWVGALVWSVCSPKKEVDK